MIVRRRDVTLMTLRNWIRIVLDYLISCKLFLTGYSVLAKFGFLNQSFPGYILKLYNKSHQNRFSAYIVFVYSHGFYQYSVRLLFIIILKTRECHKIIIRLIQNPLIFINNQTDYLVVSG